MAPARAAAAGLAAYAGLAHGFYLPGIAPIEYDTAAPVELKVNTLTSVRTQLPYSYYVLPYCQPAKIEESLENLGEILSGDQIENSPYEIAMKVNTTCKVLCERKLSDEDRRRFKSMMDDGYLVNWIVDNLPAATRTAADTDALYRGSSFTYMNGFPVGRIKDGQYLVNNHVTIDLRYHASPQEYQGFRIVGFEVEPRSLQHPAGGSPTCSHTAPPLDVLTNQKITFTYDVQWHESPLRWASRWDNYLKMSAGQVHWFSILNSVLIMAFLTGIVAMILIRTLHSDIAKYNSIDLVGDDDLPEESGWKLVHGDVFRRPRHSKLLVVCVGSGVQILGMSVVTLIFAVLGFISPAHRGALLQSVMLLFTFMGSLGGYVAARLYKTMGGADYKAVTLLTALLFPGLCFAVFFVLNLCIWGERSAGAVPFPTMIAVVTLWFGISVPLVFLGAFLAFKKRPIELPAAVSKFPRQIPEQPWWTHIGMGSMVGGFLPFAACFTELFFIMTSLWQHQFYYLFGFLVLVLVILAFTCAEISIAFTYQTLVAENYHWWWRAFLSSGSSGLYVFIYSVYYFLTKMDVDKVVPTLFYFGYMSLFSVIFTLMTGSMGLLASFAFVQVIYGSVKID